MRLCFLYMHPRKLWLICGLLATCVVHAAVVYKWKDAAGTIHFSDQPVPGAERIVTSAPNTAEAGPKTPAVATQGDSRKPTGLDYAQFEISSPAKEQSFFNDESVGVSLSLSPALKPNQSLTWQLNGQPLESAPPNSTSFTIGSLDRGAYTLIATITDEATGQTRSSDTVAFYMKKPSALAPQHQRN
jgi:hypothetical protein